MGRGNENDGKGAQLVGILIHLESIQKGFHSEAFFVCKPYL
jgi:hypothetical protein